MNDDMSDALLSAREWLRYARQDMEVAQRAMQSPPLTVAAFFHAQQAAEKALKAYWAFLCEDRIPRTHDLLALSEGLQERGGIQPPLEDLKRLAAYPVGIRYPEVDPPTEDEARGAMDSAANLLAFIAEAIGPDL
jgi:HEPN domain-containing protein